MTARQVYSIIGNRVKIITSLPRNGFCPADFRPHTMPAGWNICSGRDCLSVFKTLKHARTPVLHSSNSRRASSSNFFGYLTPLFNQHADAQPHLKPSPPPQTKMQTVLIVGATGNIGASAIHAALRSKLHVLAIVRNQASAEKLFRNVGTREGITTVEADIMSDRGVKDVVEKVRKGELPAFQHVYAAGESVLHRRVNMIAFWLTRRVIV